MPNQTGKCLQGCFEILYNHILKAMREQYAVGIRCDSASTKILAFEMDCCCQWDDFSRRIDPGRKIRSTYRVLRTIVPRGEYICNFKGFFSVNSDGVDTAHISVYCIL